MHACFLLNYTQFTYLVVMTWKVIVVWVIWLLRDTNRRRIMERICAKHMLILGSFPPTTPIVKCFFERMVSVLEEVSSLIETNCGKARIWEKYMLILGFFPQITLIMKCFVKQLVSVLEVVLFLIGKTCGKVRGK